MTGGTNLKTWIVMSVFLLGMGCATAAGRTIYVDDDEPADFNNIQEAINDANNADTVIVADGVYTGLGNRDIDFLDKAITVRSENGPENCIIDCNGTEAEPHRGFYFHNGEDSNSVLHGFTIANGYASYGGGIKCSESSSPTINNCIITDNSAENDGGGIYCWQSSPTLTNCTFSRNSAPTVHILVDEGESSRGGAMCNYENGSPTLIHCVFSNNLAAIGGGGIFNYLESNPILTDCIFSNNSVEFGGAILNYLSNPTLTNCTFSGNFADWGSGMINLRSSSLVLTNCILWDGGDEIQNRDSAVTITYSNVQGGWIGDGNINEDPLFADAEDGDYHLKSQAGQWDPNSQSWVQDEVTSPCIDAGDPMSPIGYEPFPNGGIINMGAYGGTAEASKSYFGQPLCEIIVAGDINGDCIVNFKDFALMALHWLEDRSQ